VGKRSSFERVPRDFYPTPYAAIVPLLPHLPSRATFSEPCAGNGALIDHLERGGLTCSYACDIYPQRQGIARADYMGALGLGVDFHITNPPWAREVLHGVIHYLSADAPTWLLFDADWMHTRQSTPFMPYLRKIVSVGRVKWIPDSKMTGKDNCCWYLFDQTSDAPAQFIGRDA
jgi:hypothetical protein